MITKLLAKKNMSIRQLSILSGIPYSTLNEMIKGKANYHKCSIEVFDKISIVLGVSIDELYHNFKLMDGVTGISPEYMIEYKWCFDNTYKLKFSYQGKSFSIDAPEVNEEFEKQSYMYNICAGWNVDEYIDQVIFESEVNDYLKGKNYES